MERGAKVRENRLRRWAKRLGLEMHKDRSRLWHIHKQGGYQLLEAATGRILAGPRYELSLDDLERELEAAERRLRYGA